MTSDKVTSDEKHVTGKEQRVTCSEDVVRGRRLSKQGFWGIKKIFVIKE